MRILGIVFSILLWLLFGWKTISDSNNCCRGIASGYPVVTPVQEKDNCPICFKYNEEQPELCDNWSEIRDRLIASCDQDDNIVIELLTSKDEDNHVANARAIQMKTLFEGVFDQDRLIIRSRQQRWSEPESCLTLTSLRKSSVTSINDNIVEIDNRIVIYFPVNSTKRINNIKVETYLNEVAATLRNNNKKVKLTGHTDDKDSPSYNLELGQRRAEIIKTYLVTKGISPSRIVAMSKGETIPLANNATVEGRSKNRRTELEIID